LLVLLLSLQALLPLLLLLLPAASLVLHCRLSQQAAVLQALLLWL
jgi:hypothetical protein